MVDRISGARAMLVMLLATTFVGVGCKAGPAKPAGFADSPDMKADPNVPFQRYWRKPGFDSSKYRNIYVAPVNTSYMLKLTDWQKGERQADIQKDVDKIAVFMQQQFARAFKEEKNHRFTVVDSPTMAGDCLTFESALVEVVPSKVTLNALGYAPFFIGTGITVARAAAQDYSSAAFEARVKDSQTGEVIMLLADREGEQVSLVSVRGLTWYAHAETIIKSWSDQMVQVLERKGNQKIKDTDPFTLMPW